MSAIYAIVRLDLIDPNPLQPRLDMGDLAALTASILEVGVVEPVVLVANGTRYTLMAGHRRVEGSKAAGLTTIPAVVHDAADEHAQVASLIAENTVRTNLTALEEAAGIQSMLNVGWKEPGAAIGRSTEHVARAVKVAAMPDALKEVAVQATLDEAVTLAEFADDDKAVKTLTKALTDGSAQGFAWTAADLRKKRDNKAAIAAATADLKAQGIRVVKRDYMGSQRELTWLKDANGGKFTVKSHASCPGHAATVCVDYTGVASISYVCTDSVAQHGGAQHDAKAEAQRAKEAEERDKAKAEWITARTVRFEFVRKMLRGKLPSGVLPWAFGVLIEGVPSWGVTEAFEELWGSKPGLATEKYAPCMIAALAATQVEGDLENALSYAYTREPVATKRYLELLMTEGYAPSPVERAYYDRCCADLKPKSDAKGATVRGEDCDGDCESCDTAEDCEDAS